MHVADALIPSGFHCICSRRFVLLCILVKPMAFPVSAMGTSFWHHRS